MNRQKRRLWRCAVLWMTVWLLLCGTVHAAGGTLTLRYAFDGVAFPSTVWRNQRRRATR